MLELKNVSYEVVENGVKHLILNNISCVFDNNCITAITGHNGSGKSTLTKIIMGIIQQTSGKIFLDGVDISHYSIEKRANIGMNYAFQQPITFKGVTVKELIDIATKTNNSIPLACEVLSKVGMCAKEYINRDFDKTLSGGEQKRIELALAMAKAGGHYIFDEPEAGIDLWSFEKINELLDRSKCNIIVTHQEKMLKNADKILVLSHGEIQDFGSSKQILKRLNNKVCAKIGGDNEIR